MNGFDAERARRNINPHAEARLAMAMWSHEYAHEQRGGCMDFWDSIGPSRRRIVTDTLNSVLKAMDEQGRAPADAKP